MTRHLRNLATRGLALAGMATLLSCSFADELLKVENPSELPISEVTKTELIPVLVNSVVGDFTHMYDDPFIWRGSMFTDEQVTGINWEQTARLNLRIVQYNEGDADLMFNRISRALRSAEDVSERLSALLTNPDSDIRLARTLAFAGYSYTVMGEAMCEATVSKIDVNTGEVVFGDKILPPDSLFARALPHFQDAITIASAAGTDTASTNVLNLARVGLARAALNLGQNATAISAASAVPATFKYELLYSASTPREENVLYARVTGGNHALGMHPHFLQGTFGDSVKQQPDPRIQHTVYWSKGHNALTQLYKPYQGLRFEGYNGARQGFNSTKPVLYDRTTDIVLADGVEAQHHRYEAEGPTAATSAFIDTRRAAGFQSALNFAAGDPAMMAELREQRGRDLFMGGFRLGDLRRWKKQGVGDFFPAGPHVNAPWGLYSTATCYPLPLEEYEGNPNIKDQKPTG